MGYSRKFLPSPIEDVSAAYAKSLEFHLLFCKIFLEIQSEKTKKCGFWAPVWIFLQICVKIRIFVKNLEIHFIQEYILPKKAGNPTSSTEGGREGNFFLEQPIASTCSERPLSFQEYCNEWWDCRLLRWDCHTIVDQSELAIPLDTVVLMERGICALELDTSKRSWLIKRVFFVNWKVLKQS